MVTHDQIAQNGITGVDNRQFYLPIRTVVNLSRARQCGGKQARVSRFGNFLRGICAFFGQTVSGFQAVRLGKNRKGKAEKEQKNRQKKL
jgi:hypothetical protein